MSVDPRTDIGPSNITLSNKFFLWIDGNLLKVEKALTLLGAAVLVALLLLICVSFYVMPRFTLSNHGHLYAQLSQAPFDFSQNNPLSYRPLVPAIAYFLQVPAGAFVLLPWLFMLLTLTAIYSWYRRKLFSPSEALLMSLLMAFSSAILIPLIAPGYTDIATYFFLFLCFAFVQRKYFFSLFFCLALFTHENAVLVLPALFAYSLQANQRNRHEWLYLTIAVVVAVIPYLLYRRYVDQHAEIAFDLSFYLNTENITRNFGLVARLAPIGAFFAFKLFWFIPLVYVAYCFRQGKITDTLPVFLIIAGTSMQLLIAYDITRLFAFSFMAILLSAEKLKEVFPSKWSTYVFYLFVLNCFVPQYFISQEGLNDMFRQWFISSSIG
jgi:hypothetical protein